MERYDQIRSLLTQYGLDAMLLCDMVNRRYAAGLRTSAGAVLVTEKETYYITDSRFIEAARASVRGAKVLMFDHALPLNTLLGQLVEAEGVRRLGVEEGLLSFTAYGRLQEAVGTRLCPGQGLIDSLRSQKGPEEKAALIASQRLIEEAYRRTLEELHVGMTERQVSARLVYYMTLLGAERISFGPIVTTGTRTSLPHGEPGDNPIRSGSFLTMDFGCVLDGWCSDMTRTVAFGYVTEEMERIYGTVLAAQQAAISTARANIPGRVIDAAARSVIQAAGYGAYFSHNLGHGMGMAGHEGIGATPTEERILPVGAVISAEPGIYLPGRCGVRIEDILYLTEEGAENITAVSKDLLVL